MTYLSKALQLAEKSCYYSYLSCGATVYGPKASEAIVVANTFDLNTLFYVSFVGYVATKLVYPIMGIVQKVKDWLAERF